MTDYKSMYFKLFNRVSDVISLLQSAQQEGESAFSIEESIEDNGNDENISRDAEHAEINDANEQNNPPCIS